MGEEEKMLRGQENEMMKKTLSDTCEDLDNKLSEHKQGMGKIIEDEKDERAAQHDDMINRLDRERKERIKGNDKIQNQLHDELEAMATKHVRDTEELKDALDKEAEMRQTLRNDLEKELIEQGKEIFNELDKNKNDIDMKLAKEVENRQANEKLLRIDMEGSIKGLLENIDDTKTNLFERHEDECKLLHDTIEKGNNDLSKNLNKLAGAMEGNNDDLRKELEQEKNERKQDKVDTYSDFEQICRNIDDRVTGEKEKLWDKLKEDEEKFDNYKIKCEDENTAMQN